MSLPYRIVEGNAGVATLTAFNVNAEDPVVVIDGSHPHWGRIVEGLKAGDSSVFELVDVATGTVNRLRSITERVSWNGSEVLWDGDPVHSLLADQLARAINQSEPNIEALARFWEKLETNPSEHSKAQAYSFLAAHKFQITPEGDVVGFKGLVDKGDGVYSSTRRSERRGVPSAYVNGVALPELDYVTQRIGDVVSMPRSEVVHDPNQTCERGLHVSTYNYANSFGTVIGEVIVDPRDIVSVPNGAGGQKVRVCRYRLERIADGREGNDFSTVVKRDAEPRQQYVGYAGI